MIKLSQSVGMTKAKIFVTQLFVGICYIRSKKIKSD